MNSLHPEDEVNFFNPNSLLLAFDQRHQAQFSSQLLSLSFSHSWYFVTHTCELSLLPLRGKLAFSGMLLTVCLKSGFPETDPMMTA